MSDRIFATVGDWAVASDGLQWMLMRRRSQRLGGWYGVSFVRSTRDILSRCMREKGVDDDTAAQLLSGLPETFDQWKTNRSSAQPVQEATDSEFERADRPDPTDVMNVPAGPNRVGGRTDRPQWCVYGFNRAVGYDRPAWIPISRFQACARPRAPYALVAQRESGRVSANVHINRCRATRINVRRHA
jgi:hypothetical protein